MFYKYTWLSQGPTWFRKRSRARVVSSRRCRYVGQAAPSMPLAARALSPASGHQFLVQLTSNIGCHVLLNLRSSKSLQSQCAVVAHFTVLCTIATGPELKMQEKVQCCGPCDSQVLAQKSTMPSGQRPHPQLQVQPQPDRLQLVCPQSPRLGPEGLSRPDAARARQQWLPVQLRVDCDDPTLCCTQGSLSTCFYAAEQEAAPHHGPTGLTHALGKKAGAVMVGVGF